MYDRWMRALARDTLTTSVVNQSMDARNFHREEYLNLLETAQKIWSVPEEKVSSVEQEMKNSFLQEAATQLDNQLRELDSLIAEQEMTREEAWREVF
jgi:hypothetical protein